MYLRKCFWLGLLIYLERERESVFFVGFFYNVIFYLYKSLIIWKYFIIIWKNILLKLVYVLVYEENL